MAGQVDEFRLLIFEVTERQILYLSLNNQQTSFGNPFSHLRRRRRSPSASCLRGRGSGGVWVLLSWDAGGFRFGFLGGFGDDCGACFREERWS
jgi:hypothetical protein